MNRLNSSLVESGAGANTEVRAHNTAGIAVWVLLLLVGALLASSSSLPERRLWQGLRRACGRPLLQLKDKTSSSK